MIIVVVLQVIKSKVKLVRIVVGLDTPKIIVGEKNKECLVLTMPGGNIL
jgi:hypothetical protein